MSGPRASHPAPSSRPAWGFPGPLPGVSACVCIREVTWAFSLYVLKGYVFSLSADLVNDLND